MYTPSKLAPSAAVLTMTHLDSAYALKPLKVETQLFKSVSTWKIPCTYQGLNPYFLVRACNLAGQLSLVFEILLFCLSCISLNGEAFFRFGD